MFKAVYTDEISFAAAPWIIYAGQAALHTLKHQLAVHMIGGQMDVDPDKVLSLRYRIALLRVVTIAFLIKYDKIDIGGRS